MMLISSMMIFHYYYDITIINDNITIVKTYWVNENNDVEDERKIYRESEGCQVFEMEIWKGMKSGCVFTYIDYIERDFD